MSQDDNLPAFKIDKFVVEFFFQVLGWAALIAAIGWFLIIASGEGDWRAAIVPSLLIGLCAAVFFVGYFATGRSREHDNVVALREWAKELDAENKQLKQQSGQGTEA